ncbi:MAG: hypothetical protein IJ224_05995 [Lachnospiraceae bacterium]|nr:hypothetical protein [Lachnospiraceae bacterium]
MKKIYAGLLIVLICLSLASCGKKEKGPDFADDMFVKLSYTPVDMRSEEYVYTMNVEVYQDSSVCIYADEFIKWYGENEPERVWIDLSESEIDDIKKCIVDNKIYEIQRDVGNKDNIDGVRKSIYVYTKDGEYQVTGLNPSNKQFNKVYDFITDLVRTEMTDYAENIDKIQKDGKEADVGIYITDANDSIVFEKTDIVDIYAEDMYEEATDTDAEPENSDSTDDGSLDEEISDKRIVIELNDDVFEKYENMTFYLKKDEYIVLKLYNDRTFIMTLLAYNEKDGLRVYSGNLYYDDEEIEKIIEELKEGLE